MIGRMRIVISIAQIKKKIGRMVYGRVHVKEVKSLDIQFLPFYPP